MKKTVIRAISAALVCIMICPLLGSCGDPLKSTKAESEIVMTVGDFQVPYELYRYLVLNYKAEITENEADWEDSEKAAQMTAEIEKKVESSLKSFYAVFALAMENGVYTDNKAVAAAVDAALKATRNSYASDEEYIADLAKGYMNHSVYELMQANAVCSEEVYYAVINKLELNEEKLKELISGDAFIRIKQILVVGESHTKVSDGTVYLPENSHTDQEALAIAEEALAKAKSGEDFDSLIEEYGESFHMFSNDDGYYLCRGMWEKVNEDAAFALEIGQISEIVESSAGYSIFLRQEKDPEYIEDNFDELCETYTRALCSLKLEEKSEMLQVELTEAGKALSIADIKWEVEEK